MSSLFTVDLLTDNNPIGVSSECFECAIYFAMIGYCNLVEPGSNGRFDKLERREPTIWRNRRMGMEVDAQFALN